MQGMYKNTYYYNTYLELQTFGFIIRNTLYCTHVQHKNFHEQS